MDTVYLVRPASASETVRNTKSEHENVKITIYGGFIAEPTSR